MMHDLDDPIEQLTALIQTSFDPSIERYYVRIRDKAEKIVQLYGDSYIKDRFRKRVYFHKYDVRSDDSRFNDVIEGIKLAKEFFEELRRKDLRRRQQSEHPNVSSRPSNTVHQTILAETVYQNVGGTIGSQGDSNSAGRDINVDNSISKHGRKRTIFKWLLGAVSAIFLSAMGILKDSYFNRNEHSVSPASDSSERRDSSKMDVVTQENEYDRKIDLNLFEQTFVNMLANLKSIENSLEATLYIPYSDDLANSEKIEVHGSRSFEMLLQEVIGEAYQREELQYLEGKYFYSNSRRDFETYFTTLTQLLDFVDKTDLGYSRQESNRVKRLYFKRVFSGMGFNQKVALAYHIALCKGYQNTNHMLIKRLEKKHKFLMDLWKQEIVVPSYEHYILVMAGIHDKKDYPPMQPFEPY